MIMIINYEEPLLEVADEGLMTLDLNLLDAMA